MRAFLSALIVAAGVLACPSAWADPGAKRVIISFRAGTSAAAREKALAGLGAKAIKHVVSSDERRQFVAVVAELPAAGAAGAPARPVSMSLSAAVPAASSDVLEIEEDYRVKWIEGAEPQALGAAPFPAAARLAELGLKPFRSASLMSMAGASGGRSEIPWGISRVRAPSAWDYTEGAKVRVAVIDTGIDGRHSDLRGKIDGGYSAIDDSEKPESWQDQNGHGTHVAGTIAAARDGQGVVGVAPRARLYSVRVLDADGSGSLSDVIKGIVWCAENGIQVANMSLGSPFPSPSMQRALRYAKARGVVVVAAAGNSGGSVGFPGGYPEAIAVSALDWNDRLAAFSSRGPEVRFTAPGVAVVSTYMGGDFSSLSGTSMAAPHVAGLAAMAVSFGYRGLDGPDGVLEQLKRAARPVEGLSDEEQGFGIIDAGRLARSNGSSNLVAVASLSRR